MSNTVIRLEKNILLAIFFREVRLLRLLVLLVYLSSHIAYYEGAEADQATICENPAVYAQASPKKLSLVTDVDTSITCVYISRVLLF